MATTDGCAQAKESVPTTRRVLVVEDDPPIRRI